MLSVEKLRHDTAALRQALQKRDPAYAQAIDQAQALYQSYVTAQQALETQQSHANVLAKTIGQHYQANQPTQAQALQQEAQAAKQTIHQLAQVAKQAKQAFDQQFLTLPNAPHETVIAGKTPQDNQIITEASVFMPPTHQVRPHWDVLPNALDFESATQIAGAGFVLFRNQVARLVRAMINFFLDQATKQGYEEFMPPLMVNAHAALCTGQLPDKEQQMYALENGKYYLIPTAEVPITNAWQNKQIHADTLPIRAVGYTPCFRREAGSWGADVRGLNRLHQFDKVEIVQIHLPERSYDALEEMRSYVSTLLDALELPHRVLRLCAKDLGFAAALTYDLEVYSPGQKRWLEVSSVSNFESFQARRLRLRYKAGKSTQYVHTLNGSALAIPRVLASLLEHHQRVDHIVIPAVLRPYTGFDSIPLTENKP